MYWNIPLPVKRTGENEVLVLNHSWNLLSFDPLGEWTSLKMCCSPKAKQGMRSAPVSRATLTKPFRVANFNCTVDSSPCRASWAPPTTKHVTPEPGWLREKKLDPWWLLRHLDKIVVSVLVAYLRQCLMLCLLDAQLPVAKAISLKTGSQKTRGKVMMRLLMPANSWSHPRLSVVIARVPKPMTPWGWYPIR